MNKKYIALSLLGVGLLLSSCGGQGSSETSSEFQNPTSEFISQTNSDSEISSDLVSLGATSEEESKSESSEEISSTKPKTVKEKLTEYIKACISTQNYTIETDEYTGYYLPNAYYFEDDFVPGGYAEDEKGVFSYLINNGLVGSVDYLLDENETNIKGLYEYSFGGYSWLPDVENYLVKSFANINFDDITFTKTTIDKKEAYTVPFNIFNCLLSEMHLQNFVSATVSGGKVTKYLRGSTTLTVTDEGFNIAFYSSSAFTTFNYHIKNIGTTEIPEISSYIENGGVQEETLYTQVLSLFQNRSYKVTYDDNSTRYLTSRYVLDVDGDNAHGYFISVADALIYQVTITGNEVTMQEATEVSIYSYYISESFINNFTLQGDKLLCDDYIALSGSVSYFTSLTLEEAMAIKEAEISANIVKDSSQQIVAEDCSVTFVGSEYNSNTGESTGINYTAIYSDFGSASYAALDDYLNSLN